MLLLLLVPALGVATGAQVEDPDQRYLLLATKKTGTMEKELKIAAEQGFRVVAGSPASSQEMALFLERVAEPPNTYEYVLLATTKTSTMQKELDEAAGQGFRLLPQTIIAKEQMFGGHELVVLLERDPTQDTTYEYRLLATSKTSTLQKEVTEAVNEGFVLVGMVSRGEHMVLMEKKTSTSSE